MRHDFDISIRILQIFSHCGEITLRTKLCCFFLIFTLLPCLLCFGDKVSECKTSMFRILYNVPTLFLICVLHHRIYKVFFVILICEIPSAVRIRYAYSVSSYWHVPSSTWGFLILHQKLGNRLLYTMRPTGHLHQTLTREHLS